MVKSIRFSIGILVQVLALICLSACQSPRVDVLPSEKKCAIDARVDPR